GLNERYRFRSFVVEKCPPLLAGAFFVYGCAKSPSAALRSSLAAGAFCFAITVERICGCISFESE
ncbi:MAG TPA: hypothetical protein VMJ66_17440, partial [Geobacteraceae bacterium]|nr:hypothetical protein [Geobacteraceae bacterium]